MEWRECMTTIDHTDGDFIGVMLDGISHTTVTLSFFWWL
jgi:hypothetical protein